MQEKILIKDIFKNGIKDTSIYYVSPEFIRIENSTGNYTEEYIYQDNVLVAQVNTNGNKEFVHNDHEGSNVLITDLSGNVIENEFYSPFAETISGGKASRFGYEAKEYDSLVDDIDFHFRKYKPAWGKFTQPDTLIQNVYDPQSLNRYAFERNNPYKYTDPTGHQIGKLFELIGLNKVQYYGDASDNDKKQAQKIANSHFDAKFVQEGSLQVLFGYAGKYFGRGFEELSNFFGFGSRETTFIKETDNGAVYVTPEGTYIWLPKGKGVRHVNTANTRNNDGEILLTDIESPSISNPGSQIDLSKSFSYSAYQNLYFASSGFVQGIGYVTSERRIYPTNNPYFVPGTGNAPWGGSYSNVVQDSSTGKWVIAK